MPLLICEFSPQLHFRAARPSGATVCVYIYTYIYGIELAVRRDSFLVLCDDGGGDETEKGRTRVILLIGLLLLRVSYKLSSFLRERSNAHKFREQSIYFLSPRPAEA